MDQFLQNRRGRGSTKARVNEQRAVEECCVRFAEQPELVPHAQQVIGSVTATKSRRSSPLLRDGMRTTLHIGLGYRNGTRGEHTFWEGVAYIGNAHVFHGKHVRVCGRDYPAQCIWLFGFQPQLYQGARMCRLSKVASRNIVMGRDDHILALTSARAMPPPAPCARWWYGADDGGPGPQPSYCTPRTHSSTSQGDSPPLCSHVMLTCARSHHISSLEVQACHW